MHDRAQSFVLPSYTIDDYVIKMLLLVSFTVTSKQLLHFVHSQRQKGKKKKKKHTTENLVSFHNHPPLLTMAQMIALKMLNGMVTQFK